MEEYDLIIIGGGPAGLSAAIYAARYKLKTAVFSKTIGGAAATAHKVCNYPSHGEIRGAELMQKFTEQAKNLEVSIFYKEVNKIKKQELGFIVSTSRVDYFCRKILIATGTERKRLDVSGEAGLSGKGVSYCATCDCSLFQDKIVAVIGGSNAALTAALLLTEYSPKVYIVYRKSDFFRGEPAWAELVRKNNKIECIFNEEVVRINGKDKVESIDLKSGKTLKLEGVFIEIGSIPKIDFVSNFDIKKDERGYILVDKTQKTNEQGVYAAGDITNNSLKQIITAGAEGAVAAYNIYQEIQKDSQESEPI